MWKRVKLSKTDVMCVMLAILTGCAFGYCSLLSSEMHRMTKSDTFQSIVANPPTPTIKAVYEPITEPRVVYARNDDIVINRIVDDGIPTEVKIAAEKWGKHYGICPELIEALAYEEIRYISDVVSKDGSCIGLCQVNPKCHKNRMEKLGVTDLTDIDGNIAVATDYLEELFEEHEDVAEVLYLYNGNVKGAQRLRETGEVKSAYVLNILERSEDLEFAHGKK